jgi:protein translocase SecG subunit
MLGSVLRWEMLWYPMVFLYVIACIGLIVVVLLQKGKGVGFAGAFGIGAGTDAVFGPRSGRSLPQKLTYLMAAMFMVLAFLMSLIAGRLGKGDAPGKMSEDAVKTTQTDLGVLDDLGSGLPESAPVTAAPGEAAPAGAVAVTRPVPPASEPKAETPKESAPPPDATSPAAPVAPPAGK